MTLELSAFKVSGFEIKIISSSERGLSLNIGMIALKENYGYVYKTTLPNGQFYVGQKKSKILIETYYGSGVKLRTWFKENIGYDSTRCPKEKADEADIKREILAWASSAEELSNKEIFYILQLKSENMLNVSMSPYQRDILEEYYKNPKTKEFFSQQSRERVYYTKNFNKMNEKNKEINLKQWADPETHEERRKKMAAKTGRKVLCIETGQVFDSANHAQQVLGIKNHILSVCNGKRKTAGGLHFIFAE